MKDLIFALIWFVVLGIYIFVSWKDAKSNNDVKKEITQMNELLLEQNTQLRKQNDHLNMVTEQSHPMTITAFITNRNNKKRTQLHHKLSIISFDKG